MLKRNEVKEAVMAGLKDVSEDKDFSVVDEQTNVVKELGLETDDGNDLAAILRRRLGISIPDDINPLFNDAKKGKSGFERTVGDIIDLVCTLAAKETENA